MVISIGEGLSNYNERYSSVRLDKKTIEKFTESLKGYINKIDLAVKNKEDEEYIKNTINEFLKSNFYSSADYEINTAKRIDSTIRYNGEILAIIETKKPSNIAEMPAKDNINKKALYGQAFIRK